MILNFIVLLFILFKYFYSSFNNFHVFLRFNINVLMNDMNVKRDLVNLVNEMAMQTINDTQYKCLAIICDSVYLNVFSREWFNKINDLPYIMVVVEEYEDLLSPNYETLESIRRIRQDGCKLYLILIANGFQVARLLRFGDRYRVLDTRAKYIMLHDFRLFESNWHFIWRRIVNVIFIRHYIDNDDLNNQNSWFELSTVPFPSPIKKVFVPRRLSTWKSGARVMDPSYLFNDKTKDLRGHQIEVVTFQHIPAVLKLFTKANGKNIHKNLKGMEVEIINELSIAMNFKPILYETKNSNREKWGSKQLNGTFSGLLGEIVDGKADLALANLHYTPYHLQLTDLSIPYISQCLTFLTPESLTDNSWKTLILPFKLYMWVAVLLLLFVSGFIFYALARFHKSINQETDIIHQSATRNSIIKITSNNMVGLYLFEELPNSILYTYGMLLVVSLPKLPPGWSIRLLTGWYWLYCVLVVVSYRASMTAILAMPASRVTIDTMKQLAESPVTCAGWGEQVKDFFVTALDETGQKIGNKFEKLNDADEAIQRIVKGDLAYYENVYFLKSLIVEHLKNVKSDKKEENMNENTTMVSDGKKSGSRNLHVMKDCAVHMPISIGLQKNSPLKPRIDKLLRRIIEAGLIEKWLNDVMVPINSVLSAQEENVKAIMNLQKLYGGFVALGIGYFLGFLALIGEIIYWHAIVKRDPTYDKYSMDSYYSKRKNGKK